MCSANAIATHWAMDYRPQLAPPQLDPGPSLDEVLPIVLTISILSAAATAALNSNSTLATVAERLGDVRAWKGSPTAARASITNPWLVRIFTAWGEQSVLSLSTIAVPANVRRVYATRLCALAVGAVAGRRAAALDVMPSRERAEGAGPMELGTHGTTVTVGVRSPSETTDFEESTGPKGGVDWPRFNSEDGAVVEGAGSIGIMAGILAAGIACLGTPSLPASFLASQLAGIICRFSLRHVLRLRLAATAASLYTVGLAGIAGGLAGLLLAEPLDVASHTYLWVLGLPAHWWVREGWPSVVAPCVGAAAGVGMKLASVRLLIPASPLVPFSANISSR